MARSDLVIDLVEAQQRGDVARFRMLVEAIIAEERNNQHHLVADRLSELITTAGARSLLAGLGFLALVTLAFVRTVS